MSTEAAKGAAVPAIALGGGRAGTLRQLSALLEDITGAEAEITALEAKFEQVKKTL